MSDSAPITTVALVSDLFFATRIRSTAEMLGAPLVLCSTPATLQTATSDSAAAQFIIDLGFSVSDPLSEIRTIRAARPQAQIIAFASHVQAELMRAARTAGADLVLPRSEFTNRLPAILKQVPEADSANSIRATSEGQP